MKILFVYSTINCICTTKCTYELSKALKKHCITEVINYRVLSNDIVEKFDIIILQRIGDGIIISKEDKENIFNIIRKNRNKKFVYIVDDLIIESQHGLPKELATICDAVMCSSDRLCNNFKKYNKNVIRFNTFIDINFYESIKRNIYNKFTMAWVSTDGLGLDILNEIINRKEVMNIDFDIIAIGKQSYNFIRVNYVKC